MKKMVKLLSIIMLFTMLFSMMSVSASAIINDGSAKSSNNIVIGGSGNASVNEEGNVTVGADMRPADDSPWTGIRVEDYQGQYQQQLAQARADAFASGAAVEIAKQYMAKAESDYSGIKDSELSLVQDNQDFLMYLRDNLDIVDGATLQTAVDLFGEDVVYGEEVEVDTERAETDLAEVNAEIAAIEAEYAAAAARAEAEAQAAAVAAAAQAAAAAAVTENVETEEGIFEVTVEEGMSFEAEAFGAEPEESAGTAEDAEAAAPSTDTPAVSTPDIAENEEYKTLLEKKAGIELALSGEMLKTKPTAISSKWSDISDKGKSLAQAVQGGGTVKFKGPSFDICNSTDYRITINLNGSTIDATACDAAFTIRKGVYGGTISFTNGTILGDGFYVTDNGVLNLGGLVNTTADITVYTTGNAVYVDSTGYCVIGQGTTLNGWMPSSNPTVPETLGTKPVVYIESGGTVVMTGGAINSGNSYGVDVKGGSFEMASSVAEVNSTHGYPAINATTDGSVVTIHGGVVYGSTGIVLEGETTSLTVNGGAITGYKKDVSNNYEKSGAAIEVHGDAKDGGESAVAYIYGGTLRSEYSAGVVNLSSDGTRLGYDRADIKRITVDDVNVTIQQKKGEISDYAKAIYLVTGNVGSETGYQLTSGYSSLDAACTAANALYGAVTIRMIDDDPNATTKGEINNSNATSVTFDGAGHEIMTGKNDCLWISSDNVTVKNVTINGKHGADAISVWGDNVLISEVTVEDYVRGLYSAGSATADDAGVIVNGFNVDRNTDVGIYAKSGKTTVVMCKIDADAPVDSDSGAILKISGGWFLHKEDINAATLTAARKVATYVDPDVSYVKYVEADRYYEVLYNDTPTVEIKAGVTGLESDGTPYVLYDKGDPDPIIFNVTPDVVEIVAVAESGKEYPLFSAEAGRNGDIRIPDSKVLQDCPAGKYDLKFRFKNGYVIENKLHFYVFPKFAGLFEVPNNLELSPSNGNIVKYLTNENKTDKYNVDSGKNIAIVMSELPDKVAIGNVADGSAEILLENYIFDKATTGLETWGVVPSGPYKDYYFYFISYADLNNLPVGQNYAFLYWDGIDGALERMPISVKNSNVSISPSKLEWSQIDSYANFTVKPSVDTVYIDGNKVEDGYWTYDTKTHVLSIKASYLSALPKTDHTLEVITPQGKVSATLNTSVGLRAKGIDYHVYGGARALSFVASDKILQDRGIWIGSSNPTKLDPSAYTWDGTTGFTLNSAFLNRLALGTYYISCYVYNGKDYQYTTTTFKVISASQASYNPGTGDNSNIFVWIAILALSAVALVVILLPRLRKGKTGK